MKLIRDVASKLDINSDDLYNYGNYIAKVTTDVNSDKTGKLILVTAINPTPYGEGKTTVSIGLNDALWKINKKSVALLREPSLGPVFGLKGGATGGGMARILPDNEINLHFTGDFHAITSANNLLCAAIYNHIYQGNSLNIDKDTICVKRCMDMNDRALRDGFNITAASEVMAIFCLAKDRFDLRDRLANILVAYDINGEPIYARDLKVDGAMALLLEQAFYPNVVQTLDGNPVFVHGGPFANIAHGCSSIISTKLGLGLADYAVTEAGFGSDLGAEKFIDIKCRQAGIKPSMIVLVVTVRALKHSGIDNLQAHIDNLNNYNVPFCVALNHFIDDKNEDIQEIEDYCKKRNVDFIMIDPYNKGGAGVINLAKYIVDNTSSDTKLSYIYSLGIPVIDKMNLIATKVYHAKDVIYSDKALDKLEQIEKLGVSHYPICVSKTPFSISDDAKKLGYPKDYRIVVDDIIIQTGSRMLIFLLNKVITMPGLPQNPRYEEFE